MPTNQRTVILEIIFKDVVGQHEHRHEDPFAIASALANHIKDTFYGDDTLESISYFERLFNFVEMDGFILYDKEADD